MIPGPTYTLITGPNTWESLPDMLHAQLPPGTVQLRLTSDVGFNWCMVETPSGGSYGIGITEGSSLLIGGSEQIRLLKVRSKTAQLEVQTWIQWDKWEGAHP